MIFKEQVSELMGQPVWFLTTGHNINKGILEGLSGSGSVIVRAYDERYFVSPKHIFLTATIPDESVMWDYVVAKYGERIQNLDTLVRFPLDFDLEHDREAREAYLKGIERILGCREVSDRARRCIG